MLKKVLSSVILLVAMNVSASENYFASEWDAKGLIAIEGAGGSMDLIYKDTTMTPTTDYSETASSGAVSLKLGGETKFYRLFLSGTYYMFDAPDTSKSSAVSLGLQMDYLIRAGEHFNIFMGLNGGGIYSDFQEDLVGGGTVSQTSTDAFAGAQAGVNIDIIDNLGIELGARYKHVFAGNDVASIDNIYEGYASIVFKFTGEY